MAGPPTPTDFPLEPARPGFLYPPMLFGCPPPPNGAVFSPSAIIAVFSKGDGVLISCN